MGAGLWCLVLGVGVAASLVDSGSLGRAGTITLLGAVGMLVLPGLTLLAMRVDARERRRMMGGLGSSERVSHPAHVGDGPRREAPAHRARGHAAQALSDRMSEAVG